MNPLSHFRILVFVLLMSGQCFGQTAELTNAAFLFVGEKGQDVRAQDPDRAMIPASTTKLVTAWLALKRWGVQHRFKTPFYFDAADKVLWIKGAGDPYLISDEIKRIAIKLAASGIDNIEAIGIDDSLFRADLTVPGGSLTTNPYDAIPAPLAANFNTVAIAIQQNHIVSAEPETPLTEFARSQAFRIKGTSERINTGPERQDAGRYFAELLAIFLRQQGVKVNHAIIWGKLPDNIPPVYQHTNSRTLADMIRPMMKYSNNFIANQLALLLAVEKFEPPVDFYDVRKTIASSLSAQFDWKHFFLEEGAGLSRKNRLSHRQLTELLHAFRPWRDLLPQVSAGIYAKSGTLNGVSTLAGFLVSDNEWRPFALMMQHSVSKKRRLKIVRALSRQTTFNTQSH